MIARNLEEAGRYGPAAVTIGNFDGVHLGHRALLRATSDAARARGLRPVVLMFDPHPACVVAPERAPRLLTTPQERCTLLAEEGISDVLILPFTSELARLEPADFARQYLHGGLQARVVLVGRGFRFGHRQSGDAAMLERLGRELGFATEFVDEVRWRRHKVSASEVRKSILGGDVSTGCRLLRRPHSIAGEIVRGHGIGSKKTVPTLNLRTAAQVIPANGVYVTRTADSADGRRWNSITNIGHRPTFGGDPELSIETFLLDPLEGATPESIRVEFLRRVRDEKRFETPEVLKAQILLDVKFASSYFRRLKALKSIN